MNSKKRNGMKIAIFSLGFLAASSNAHAFKALTTGDMWYEFYDIFFTKLLQGPMGATLTGGTLAWGLVAAVRGSIPTFLICTLAAGVMISLENVVQTFGYIA